MKRTMLAIALAVACAAVGCATPAPRYGEQVPKQLVATTQRSTTYNYLEYWPAAATSRVSGEKWPLVIFLHGAGERGTDVSKVAAHGPPKQAAAGRAFPFVLLSPQCPADQWWDVDTLQAMLDDFLKQHGEQIDRERIYLTGLSMGGGGTWDWITRDRHPFAAAAPVCGATSRIPIRLKDPIPVWAFHGDKDDVVPPWITSIMADQWRAAGGQIRVSMYEGVNHGSWDRAYDEPELWDWLLSHKKRPPTEGRAKWIAPASMQNQK